VLPWQSNKGVSIEKKGERGGMKILRQATIDRPRRKIVISTGAGRFFTGGETPACIGQGEIY